MSLLETYLKSCSELTRFCSQNGWIDDQSLHYTIIMETGSEAFVEVEFDELITTGPGNQAARVSCSGQLHLHLDSRGRIIGVDVL